MSLVCHSFVSLVCHCHWFVTFFRDKRVTVTSLSRFFRDKSVTVTSLSRFIRDMSVTVTSLSRFFRDTGVTVTTLSRFFRDTGVTVTILSHFWKLRGVTVTCHTCDMTVTSLSRHDCHCPCISAYKEIRRWLTVNQQSLWSRRSQAYRGGYSVRHNNLYIQNWVEKHAWWAVIEMFCVLFLQWH